MKFFSSVIALLFAIFIGFYIYFAKPQAPLKITDIIEPKDSYSLQIQPFFDSKCVACHSCYNSPCQLNLSSFEGLERGANKINIYDFPPLESREPTRLYQDAHSESEWRKKGFYSVLPAKNNHASLIEKMVQELPGIEVGIQKSYISETSRYCSKDVNDLAGYKKNNPAGRMPFGLPKATSEETQALTKWIKKATPPPSTSTMEKAILDHKSFKAHVVSWERFFNAKDIKSQLSARYLYEHLFLAHIFFEEQPKIFFRLVRSETKKGQIQELATTFPFDDPGKDFYYRLRPVTNTLTLKDHIPFVFSETKLKNYKQSFLQSDWPEVPKAMPAYGRGGGNPFEIFKFIPVKARYNFFLEEAGYHIMTFIKGPVCRGPTALNVINDQFWVMFIAPEHDAMVNSRALELKIAKNSEFPSQVRDDISPFMDFRDRYWQSVDLKFQELSQKTLTPKNIWNGDKKNTNALLTVYRHFDSAQVIRGLRGGTPKTIWIMDYHVFESVYYNLTAGYNVFGAVPHQVNSRLFMEMSRLASEDMFINFLPPEDRAKIRLEWNKPVPEKKESIAKKAIDLLSGDVKDKLKYDYPYFGKNIKSSSIATKDKDPKLALMESLLNDRFSKHQLLSTHDSYRNDFKNRTELKKSPWNEIHKIKGLTISHLPDTLLIRVEDTDEVFTLVHNREHHNVSMMILEEDLLDPSSDTLDVIFGVTTAYANAFVILNKDRIESFVKDMSQVSNKEQADVFLKKYLLSRSDARFWEHHAWFSDKSREPLTNESGILDLNRYTP